MANIRAVADYRGTFAAGTRAVLFLKISDGNGVGVDPEAITINVVDPLSNVATSGTPEKVSDGFFAFDWTIDQSQTLGKYSVTWDYTVDSVDQTELQEVVVTAYNASSNSLYNTRIQEFRMALTYMISCAQNVVIRREPGQVSRDLQTYEFSFPRWNQSGVKIYRNDIIVNEGLEIDFFKGKITFDNKQTRYDRIEASYNFRWFSDEQIDTFLSNSLGILNSYPPVTRKSFYNIADKDHALLLYGAAVDALRALMLCLQFQQPQLVFGGADAAGKAFSNLDSIKKNYEETWNKLLEQKKYGSYKGLTKTIVTPEFALPGGRSRWFRYLFSGGS